jgi:hypothetical protein
MAYGTRHPASTNQKGIQSHDKEAASFYAEISVPRRRSTPQNSFQKKYFLEQPFIKNKTVK